MNSPKELAEELIRLLDKLSKEGTLVNLQAYKTFEADHSAAIARGLLAAPNATEIFKRGREVLREKNARIKKLESEIETHLRELSSRSDIIFQMLEEIDRLIPRRTCATSAI